MQRTLNPKSILLFLFLFGALCPSNAQEQKDQPTLKDAFRDHFLIGAALNDAVVSNPTSPEGRLASTQFSSITPENVMKWGLIHPQPQCYDFMPADRLVEFGTQAGQFIVGHTLVWHQQTPAWVFQDDKGEPLNREQLLARMRDHIHCVVERYKGRVKAWDVVNEALEEDGSLRNSPWRKIIGEDFIAKAFEYAHEADPNAELYYNDYRLEVSSKREGALKLLSNLKAAGAPVTGVGIQEHINLTWPTPKSLNETIEAFAKLGLKVMITELDVDLLPARQKLAGNADVTRKEEGDSSLNPHPNGLPAEVQEKLARRYAEVFSIYLQHPGTITRVAFWGVTDSHSWLNNFPVRGRTSHPLLFDRNAKPKPAFDAVLGTLMSSGSRRP